MITAREKHKEKIRKGEMRMLILSLGFGALAVITIASIIKMA